MSAPAATIEPAAPRRPARILVVDDEESMRHYLSLALRRAGHEPFPADGGEAALELCRRGPFDAVLLDLRMPGMDGIAVLARIRELDPDASVLMMTAHGTIASAVEAMRLGAADFLTKPFEAEEILLRLDKALGQRRTAAENRALRGLLEREGGTHGLLGRSMPMRALIQQLELLRNSGSTVLLTGESGVGKGKVARTLHQMSNRADGPFVTVHCPAVPETLFESELFGHEAGAFTGARSARQGLVAKAHQGTLFLDEVSEMSPQAQAKIERFLQEKEFLPVGATSPVKVDVRVVAATNRDLQQAVAAGTFRPDLLWRLAVVQLHVPPLRERRDDIMALVTAQLRRLAEREGWQQKHCSPAVMAALVSHEWPGNVRELENVVERMAVLGGTRPTLEPEDLPDEIRAASPGSATEADYACARDRFEHAYFRALLLRCGGNVSEAARVSGLSRGHLHRRIRELGIPHGSGAPEAD